MKKRILLSLMVMVCAAVILCALPVTAEETGGACGDNLTWVLEDGVLTISGTGEMTSNGWVEYKEQITEVFINPGVTSICDSAFEGCSNLLEARLASSVTYVGFKAFAVDATRLFVYCEGDMPEFAPGWHNSGTTYLFYPEGNSTWDTYKTDKDYPGKVYKEKGNFALSGTCGENLTYTIDGTVLTISGTGPMDGYSAQKNPPWIVYDRMITKLIIEEGVTTIGSNAFSQFEKITELNLPSTIEMIDSMGFKDCRSLTEVVLPEGLVEIGDFAFEKCTGLTRVYFPSTLETVYMNAFMYCTSLEEIYFFGDAIPWLEWAFGHVNTVAYYPAGNTTWTEEMRPTCEGQLTWKPWCPDGHTEQPLEGKAPTCTEDGLTEGSHCSACGEVLTEQETIPATGHEFADGVCVACGQPVPALGDVNGDGVVDIFDANLVAACYNEVIELTQWQRMVADVNGDGEVDIFDANLIAAFYNEVIDQFPA